ncbi:hypothetical protein BH11BAC4_BH11BAC4_25170 [soil metagenome]
MLSTKTIWRNFAPQFGSSEIEGVYKLLYCFHIPCQTHFRTDLKRILLNTKNKQHENE